VLAPEQTIQQTQGLAPQPYESGAEMNAAQDPSLLISYINASSKAFEQPSETGRFKARRHVFDIASDNLSEGM
jgi:hypothetical protein